MLTSRPKKISSTVPRADLRSVCSKPWLLIQQEQSRIDVEIPTKSSRRPPSQYGIHLRPEPRRRTGSISPDSIQVTLKKVQLDIVNSEANMEDGLTPSLQPTGGKEAQIWFTLGFMLNSCRVETIERVGSDHPSMGSTVHDITFHCHYKASEFRSALRDMLK